MTQLPEIPYFLTHWIFQYGNFALFALLALGIIGLPIPDETLLAFTGFLVAQGKLPLGYTLLAAFLGAAVGISISYLLGLLIGKFVIEKYGGRIGITPEKIKRVQNWFDRVGKWAVFIGYFIPGVRHLSGYLAGSMRVHFIEFAFFAYSGALFWSIGFISLGYFFSNQWENLTDIFSDYLLYILAGILLVIFSYVLWRILKRYKLNKAK